MVIIVMMILTRKNSLVSTAQIGVNHVGIDDGDDHNSDSDKKSGSWDMSGPDMLH